MVPKRHYGGRRLQTLGGAFLRDDGLAGYFEKTLARNGVSRRAIAFVKKTPPKLISVDIDLYGLEILCALLMSASAVIISAHYGKTYGALCTARLAPNGSRLGVFEIH